MLAKEGLPSPVRRCYPNVMGSQSIALRDLSDPHLLLREPMYAELEVGPPVTAWSPDLHEYGSGQDEREAVEDLKASVVELYRTLKDHADHLGPFPCRQWAYLQRYIQEA
jgi:hypothetical protein